MDKFEAAYQFTARWEGGLTDDQADAGGITNYGVSFEFLKDCARLDSVKLLCLGIQTPVTRKTIVDLRKDQARDLFRWRFWDVPGFERYALPLAVTLFDCSVNHGVSRGIKLAQKAFNTICANPALTLVVDGIQGPKTKAALEASNAFLLAKAIVSERKAFYQGIVDSRPSQRVFLRGWMNRANDLDKYLDTLGQQ